jgi:tRNA(His) 5'-end guanylyltransferase
VKLEDSLGDKLKEFEFREAGRTCLPGLPIIARLDGRAFHTFTKGLQRPYDQRLSDAMVATTCALIEETHASLGYTQSDEITLLWQNKYSETSEMLFSGRYQKLTSILASLASVEFFKQVIANIPEKKDRTPVFDCRVFQLPT